MKFTLVVLLLFYSAPWAYAEKAPSTCYGTTKDGRLENGWQLPSSGRNFEAYSSLGVALGRNYVHSTVYKIVVDAYRILETTAPGIDYIYGETGFKKGGRFKPHKTHANGLSVDFFVPVVNRKGKSVKLSINPMNKFGYAIEFDKNAHYRGMLLDFESMARHLLALKKTADAHGAGIRVVIFDNAFQKRLFATPTGKKLPGLMDFSVKKPWVRHDEHYHIDFKVRCAD